MKTIAIFVFLSLSAYAQAPQPRTVLFVCEHGAAKSVIAAEEFNRLAKQKGLPFHAIARGVHPDQEIAANVRKGLAADGMDVGKSKPVAVTDADIKKADQVITMGCLLPPKAPKKAAQDWKDLPNVSENFDAARAAIVKQVEALLNDLAAHR